MAGREESAPGETGGSQASNGNGARLNPLYSASMPLSRRQDEAPLVKKAFSFADIVRIAQEKMRNKSIRIQVRRR